MKVGIMDEERRTTLNLRHASKPLRTGSSSSTPVSWTAPVTRFIPRWRPADDPQGCHEGHHMDQAYEDANVDTGLAAGFSGRAQIGKGCGR